MTAIGIYNSVTDMANALFAYKSTKKSIRRMTLRLILTGINEYKKNPNFEKELRDLIIYKT